MKKEYIKVLIFALALIAFESAIYMLCKLSPLKITVLSSTFDDKLPFIPIFSIFYYLWYIYLFFIPLILYHFNKEHLFKYASITIFSIIIGGIIFVLFPTTINRGVNLDNYKSIFTYLVRFIYFTDTPNYCCLPSMHCALSFIAIYMILKVKDLKLPYKLLIIIGAFGIIASTLFIKQHVIWDVIAALVLVVVSIIIDRFTKFNKFIEKKYESFDFHIKKQTKNHEK